MRRVEISYRKIRHPRYKYRLETRARLEAPELRLHLPKHPSAIYSAATDSLVARILVDEDPVVVEVHPGYAWDGASGPAVDTKTFLPGSLFHDVLYQHMRIGYLPQRARPIADRLMRDINVACGMWYPRAQWTYWGVRLFGAPFARFEVLRAP